MTEIEAERRQAELYLSECEEYTDAYEHEKLVRDWEKKGTVARNVVGDFTRRAGDPRGKRLIDLGFGNGVYAIEFAKAGALVSGLEVNSVLHGIAKERAQSANLSLDLNIYDGRTFPHPDDSFDYAFSVSVLEHVSDAALFLREAGRVLKPGGRFYLAFPNRLSPKETHTGIWGLNYVPRSLAELLLRRLWNRNTIEDINLHFVSYWRMKRLARRAGMAVVFEYERPSMPRRAVKRILAWFGMHHSAVLRTVMVVLEKKR